MLLRTTAPFSELVSLCINGRIADKHRLDLCYFASRGDVSAVAEDDIDLGGGELIPASAGFSSNLDIEVTPIRYSYSFIKSAKREFYGSIGLHWHCISYQVAAVAGIGEEDWRGDVEAKTVYAGIVLVTS